MEIGGLNEKWFQLIQSVDDGIRTIALNANVLHEDLRDRYVMACLHITKPFEYNISNLTAKQKAESEIPVATMKFNGTSTEQTAAGDNTITQNGKNGKQLKISQNVTNIYKKVHMKQQQHINFGFNGNYGNNDNHKSLIRQRYQQNFYTRNVHDSNMPPYSISAAINTANRIHSYKMNDNRFNGGNTSISKLLPQQKDSNKKKVAKFYCDIEAALAGEISDVEDDERQMINRGITFNKLSNDNAMLRTSASLAKETISLVEEQLKENKQLETRVVRYPTGKSLALNVIHKVYVVELEEAYAWIRLCDDNRPPCFDAAHIVLKAMKSLEWEELLPGTPCVVLTRFNPLDVVNDGIARELTEFESYARAIIEECDQMTKTVTVRLVDFGFRLTQLDATTIKPLTIAFDGPPLAFRLQIDLLPKQQKEGLCRYIMLYVRLTISREKQFLCWTKTWKAIHIKKQNWNKGRSDCSSSMKSFEMRNLNQQYYASSNFGLATRAFVPSWLSKDNKRNGGRSFQAALRGIVKRNQSDLPSSEFALNKTGNFINKKSLLSKQSSENCLNLLATNPILLLSKFAYILYHFPKINDGWPTFAKLKRAPFELLKKESQKKEKKWLTTKKDLEGHNGLENSIKLENSDDVAINETKNATSDAQMTSSSVTTVHTCRDLL